MRLKLKTGDSFPAVARRISVLTMATVPLLLFLVLALPAALPKSPAAGPSPQIGRELQGTITVAITGSGTWQDDGAEKPSHGRIENTAAHKVKISAKQCSPPNAPGGLRAYCGKEMAFAAGVFEEEGDGESNSVTKGKISGRCPGGSDIALL